MAILDDWTYALAEPEIRERRKIISDALLEGARPFLSGMAHTTVEEEPYEIQLKTHQGVTVSHYAGGYIADSKPAQIQFHLLICRLAEEFPSIKRAKVSLQGGNELVLVSGGIIFSNTKDRRILRRLRQLSRR